MFNAEWEQKLAKEKSKGACLQAHEKFMHQKFSDLSPEEKAHYKEEAKALNTEQDAEHSMFGFISVLLFLTYAAVLPMLTSLRPNWMTLWGAW